MEEEKKVKKSRARKKKATVEQPKTSLYECITEKETKQGARTVDTTQCDDICYKTSETVCVKMMVPYLEGETHEEYAKRFPQHAHPGDLGMDVTAIAVKYDEEYDRYMYHTGVYCETEKGDGCFLMPRSSNSKTNAQMGNGIGLVETVNYRGELIFAFKDRTPLWERAFRRAIWQWAMLPWYKRLFKDFSKMLDKQFAFCKENALQWAPYKVGDRIGQIVWNKFPKNIYIEIVDELSETARGAGGFGSTGK